MRSTAELKQRQEALISDGEGILQEAKEFETTSKNWGGGRSNGMQREPRDIVEEKVPMMQVYREFFERWNDWAKSSTNFIRDAAGQDSDIYGNFKNQITATRELMLTLGSSTRELREQISSQLKRLATPVDVLVNERLR